MQKNLKMKESAISGDGKNRRACLLQYGERKKKSICPIEVNT